MPNCELKLTIKLVNVIMEERIRIVLNRDWVKFAIWGALSLILFTFSAFYYDPIGVWLVIFMGLGCLLRGMRVHFKCHNCEKDLEVYLFSENKKCSKCKTLHIIDWEEGAY